VFSRQLEALANKGDTLIAISTSGNSENVIGAVNLAKSQALRVIGLLGRDGGRLKELCDISIVVPSDSTPRIQEAHILIGHTICEGIETGLGLV
jgi:D-sedoheptulose 7-phosphate isomerase